MQRFAKLCSMSPLFLVLVLVPLSSVSGQDYKDALYKSILYFENQRSGILPRNQRVIWRGNSALNDGKEANVDLTGGYYDAGDNVKFGFPMAFTITMLSWGIVEYGKQLSTSGDLNKALEAVRWGTDYFIKAHPEPHVLWGQVGDGDSDHACWQRPEDMTTLRTPSKIDEANPGTELAAETAAAMAAASIAFDTIDHAYSKKLLHHAIQLFEFADKFRENYDKSIPGAEKFYKSFSGFNDELLWGAAWLYKASKSNYYLSYLAKNGDTLGGTNILQNEFGWDVKYVGVQTLVAEILMTGQAGGNEEVFQMYQDQAENFMCSMIGKGTNNVPKTPAGLVSLQPSNNLQFATTASFLTILYSDYLTTAKRQLNCPTGETAPPDELFSFGKLQVDYILGKNPMGISYMVGYSKKFPQHVHHRGSSIVSIKTNPAPVTCQGGFDTYYKSPASNPNVLVGAIVGGPDANDNFNDSRDVFNQNEAATYNTAPLVGVLARLSIG